MNLDSQSLTEFEEVSAGFEAEVRFSGNEKCSFRNWDSAHHTRVEFLYETYASGEDVFAGFATGTFHNHKDNNEQETSGVLIRVVSSNDLGRDTWPNSQLDKHSRIYLFQRVRAMRCETLTIGDQSELDRALITKSLILLSRSKEQTLSLQARKDRLGSVLDRIAPTEELLTDAIKIARSAFSNDTHDSVKADGLFKNESTANENLLALEKFATTYA